MMRPLALPLVLICFAAVFGCQSSPTADEPRTAAAPGAQEFTVLEDRADRLIVELPNRMVVVAQAVPSAPVVSSQVWIKTGSLYEQEHVGAGLSHFLEHLLSGGTTTTTPEDRSNAVLGGMGAATNAATSLDTVRYHINTTAEHAPTAIDRLSDWMQNSVITDAEYERERDVIQREFEMGQGDPNRILWKLTQQARFYELPGHPAGHPTIGYLDEFLDISRDEIYDFYRRMYVPNNMVFVVSGDIDPQEIVGQIADLWSGVPTGELPKVELPVETDAGAGETIEVRGVADIERPRLRLIWPGTELAAPDDYELDLLAAILGQGESSRLPRTVRDEQRLVNNAAAGNISFTWGRGMFVVDTQLANPDDTIDAAKAALLEQVALLRDEPVTQVEIDRAKRNILSSVLQQNQTAEGIAARLANDIIGSGDPDYLAKYAQRIQSITPAQLQDTAQRLLTDDKVRTIVLEPAPEGVAVEYPTRPDDVVMPAGIEMREVDLDNAAVVDRLADQLASEGNAEAVEIDAPMRFTLDNGMRVVVQRSTLVPAVSMQLYWLGGLLGEEPGREGVANAMSAMMTRGTDTRSADQIAEQIENLGATLFTASGNNTTYARGSALKEDWPVVMELMADVVKNPSFPEEEWAKLQPRLISQIDAQQASWSGELSKRFREVYNAGSTLETTPLGKKSVVESLTPEDLAAYHATRFGAKNAVLAVVGDVDPQRVRSEAERLFGDLPPEPEVAFDPQAPDTPGAMTERFATRKPLAAVAVGLGPGVTRDDPDYAALQVLARVISDFPGGWLEQALRGEGPGLVYAAYGYNVAGLIPGHFQIVFNTQPASVDEALSRAMGVVERAKTEPISDEDLQRAKAKVLTREFFGKQSNADRAAGMALDWLYGVDDPRGERFLEEVQAVDAATLQRLANERLTEPVTVIIAHETEG